MFPSVPEIPANVDSMINQMLGYIATGFGIVSQFCMWDIVKALALISAALFVFYRGYLFVLWILKKIPMVGIE